MKIVQVPNPLRDELTIHYEYTGILYLYIYTSDLKEVDIVEVEFIDNSTTIRLNDLPQGVYILQLYDADRYRVFSKLLVKV